jgi:hypothetical protein
MSDPLVKAAVAMAFERALRLGVMDAALPALPSKEAGRDSEVLREPNQTSASPGRYFGYLVQRDMRNCLLDFLDETLSHA